MCRCRRTCSRSAVLCRTLALWLGRATLTRLGPCLLALTSAGARFFRLLRATADPTPTAGITATATATALATLTAATTAAQLNRLRLRFWIRFKTRNDFDRDFALDEAFDVVQHVALVDAHQRHGRAGCTGAAGTADTVNVVFRHVRQIIVDHVRQLIDVDAACCDIGGDQCLQLAVLELSQRAGACS